MNYWDDRDEPESWWKIAAGLGLLTLIILFILLFTGYA